MSATMAAKAAARRTRRGGGASSRADAIAPPLCWPTGATLGAMTVTAVTRPERATWIGVARGVIGTTRVTGVSGDGEVDTLVSRASIQRRSSES